MKEQMYEGEGPPSEPMMNIFQDIQDNQWHVQIIDTSGNVAIIQDGEIGGIIRDLTEAQRRIMVYSDKIEFPSVKAGKRGGKG